LLGTPESSATVTFGAVVVGRSATVVDVVEVVEVVDVVLEVVEVLDVLGVVEELGGARARAAGGRPSHTSPLSLSP
jgi:hypothetical protein